MDLKQVLTARFDASRCGDLDMTIAIDAADTTLIMRIEQSTLTWLSDTVSPDFVIIFPSSACARQIIEGELSPMDAFSAGHLRSTGYIVNVFRVLAIFGG